VEINCVSTTPTARRPSRACGDRSEAAWEELNPGETKDFRLAFDNIPGELEPDPAATGHRHKSCSNEQAVTLDEIKSQLDNRWRSYGLRRESRSEVPPTELAGFMADGTLKVKVQAPPERGKANQRSYVAPLGKEPGGVNPRGCHRSGVGETSPYEAGACFAAIP